MYTIRQLCELFGTTPRTIRHYTNEGLIDMLEHQKGKTVFYDDETPEKLFWIIIYKHMGFEIDEIKQLLQLEHFERIEQISKHIETLEGKIQLLEKQIRFSKYAQTEYLYYNFDVSDLKDEDMKSKILQYQERISDESDDKIDNLNEQVFFPLAEMIHELGYEEEYPKMLTRFQENEHQIAQMIYEISKAMDEGQFKSVERLVENFDLNYADILGLDETNASCVVLYSFNNYPYVSSSWRSRYGEHEVFNLYMAIDFYYRYHPIPEKYKDLFEQSPDTEIDEENE